MATADVWTDFETVRHNVKHNTVDRLKQILISLNEQCGTNFTKTGKKQELIDRITRELDLWRRTNNSDKWLKAKTIMNQVRNSMYNSYRSGGESIYTTPPYNQFSASSSAAYPTTSLPSNIPPQYDPYSSARKPAVSNISPASSSSSTTAGIQFKHSPFFRIDRAVSNIVECPESASQMDRRQQTVSFTVSSDIQSKLSSASTKYTLRLYCTSSTYYSPNTPFRSTMGPCPIEFPPTCEVRVNSVPLPANLKGMKKKPGTAPPPDLGKLLRLTSGASNRVDMIYVNSQQPTPAKKYYLVVMLVEVTSVEQLIDKLRKGKYKSSQDIQARMALAASEDDEIVAEHQKMSLKCPLSYMRIATPTRSAKCVHSQCFDAFSWYSMMEQTTTWLCPVCEKILNTEELIVDGYFDEILKSTSEDVEDVIVEADGQWHTSDNKFASAGWKAAHAPVKALSLSLPPTPVKRRSPTPVKPVINGTQHGPGSAEIVILDSDEEDEQVKRELSPSAPRSLNASLASIGSLPPRSQTGESDVIDLTLDSEDEEPLAAPIGKKRKVDDRDIVSPTEQIWKKSRGDGPSIHTVASSSPAPASASNNYLNGKAFSPPPRDPRSPTSATGQHYISSRPPAPGHTSSYIPPGGAPIPSRAPVPRVDPYNYHGRVNGSNGTSTSGSSWRS